MKKAYLLCLALVCCFILPYNTLQAQSCGDIYVTPNGTGNGAIGSPTNIAAAVQMVRQDTSRSTINMVQGIHEHVGTINLPSHIKIYGGYKVVGSNWIKGDSTNQTNIYIIADEVTKPVRNSDGDTVWAKGVIGLNCDSISDVLISDVNLVVFNFWHSWDSKGNGVSMYGVYARKSTDVNLVRVKIVTEAAGDGKPGYTGANGRDAEWRQGGGQVMDSVLTTSISDVKYKTAANSNNFRAGGKGGKAGREQGFVKCDGSPLCALTPCVPELPKPAGEAGGRSGKDPAFPNINIQGGTGGECGDACKFDCYYDTYQQFINKPSIASNIYNNGSIIPSQLDPNPVAGNNGANGTNVRNGGNYTSQTQAAIGERREMYIPSRGFNGGDGAGGGGGGGGGAGAIRVFSLPPVGIETKVTLMKIGLENLLQLAGVDVCSAEILNIPGKGGNGGGGGEGGQGGEGGGGGGGNFGIYAVQNSTIGTLNVTYQLGPVGTGGTGGQGGQGGLGSQGRPAPPSPLSMENWNNVGAAGGNGGNGGRGGDGMTGRIGEVFNTSGLTGTTYPTLIISQKRGCTNSAIEVAIGANDISSYTWSGNSGDVTFVQGSQPNSFIAYAGTIGTLKFTSAPSSDVFNRLEKTIVISEARALPTIITGPATMCEKDTFSFSTTAVAQRYLWKMFDNNGVLIKEFTTQSGKFFAPTPNVNYTLDLQVFDDCCGWTKPVSYTLQRFQSFLKPAIVIHDQSTYCEGFGSVAVQLSEFYNLQWIREWSDSTSDPYLTTATKPRSYWVRFKFPNGCYSPYSDTLRPNINPAPTNPVPPMTFDEVCDMYPLQIFPLYIENRKYSFFNGPNDLIPMAGGANVSEFTPQFKFLNGQNTKTIYYAVTDIATGCIGFNRSPVTLNAETQPPSVYTPNYYKFNVSNANCEAYVNYPDVGTFDWCSTSGAVLDSGLGNYRYYPIGRYVNKYRAADMRGNTAYFYLTIDVVDEYGPYIANCPYNTLLNSDSGRCGTVYHHPSLTVNESCGLAGNHTWVTTSVPGYFVDDSIFPVGVNTVNRSYTDARGNTSICTYTVEVRDWTKPTITCPPDTTYYLPKDSCQMLIMHNMPEYTDNCYGATLELVQGTGNYKRRPRGDVWETYRVYDRTKSDSTMCFFRVSVRDTSAPVFTSTTNKLFAPTDTGKHYATLPMYTVPTATDACSNVNVTLESGPAPGDTASLGMSVARWKAVDAAGNIAYFDIDILVWDNQGPTLTCPADMKLQAQNNLCGSLVSYARPIGLDNDGNTYTVYLANEGREPNTIYPLGVTRNYFYATDAQGNRGGCFFTVTVVDTIAPVLTCPSDTTVYISGNLCEYFFNPVYPTVFEAACPSTLQQTYASGDSGKSYYYGARFSEGFHPIIFTVADGSRNVGRCTTYVVVRDTNTYSLSCEPGYTVNADPGQCGATVVYRQPRITPYMSQVSCTTLTVLGLGNGAFRPVGTSTDYYTYNIKGTLLSCSTSITVVDNQPTKMSNCGRDTVVYADNGQCSAAVSFVEPTILDNCPSTAYMLQWRGGPSGSSFGVGVTRNVYYIYDNMNMVDSCIFTITVADTIPPSIIAPADVIVQTDQICGTTVNFTEPEGTDNTNCQFTARVEGKAPGSVFPVGVTRQAYRVTDNWGNVDTCSFNVIVQPDTAMHVDCLSPPSTHAANGLGEVVYYQTPGNFCEGTYTVFKSGLSSGAFYPVGMNIDEYLIIDRLGDTATCAITVHVFETQPPVLTCGANVNITVSKDSMVNCMAYVNVPPTIATDYSGVNIFYNEYNFTANASGYYPIGNTQVVWKASSQGMDAQCVQFVRVNAALTTTYDTIAHRQKRCSGQTIVYNPGLTIGDSVSVQWEKLAFGSFQTISTDEVLVIENPDYFSTGGIYYLYLTSPCVQNRQLVGLFELTVYDSPEVNIGGLSTEYCFTDTARKQVITSPAGGVLLGKGIVDGYFYPSIADTGLHTLMYVRDTSHYNDNENNPYFIVSCSDTARLTVRVNAYPEPKPFIDAAYCINGSAVALDTSASSYAGAGISGYSFNPQAAGGGTHTIARAYIKGGCTLNYTKQTTVSTDVPDATIITAGPYCDNLAPQLLLAADTGGIWAADSNAIDVDTFGRAIFTPRYANLGMVPVTYSVTRGVCTANDSVVIQVKSSHYNIPYDLPEYCRNSPPIVLDTTDKRYVGPGFNSNVLYPDSFTDGGIKFYMVVGLNAIGCQDTVFRMYLVHGPDVPFNEDIVTCSGDSVQVDLKGGFISATWLDNGSTDTARWLTSPGKYAVALADTFGCVGTDTVKYSYYAKPNTGITAYGDSLQANAIVPHYQWYKNSDTLAGDTLRHIITSGNALYYVALTDSNGCITFSDTINRLVVCTTKYATLFDTLCHGQSLQIGAHVYAQTGVYVDTLHTSIGCDSILVTYLEILQNASSTIGQSICMGTMYNFNGTILSNAGSYADTLAAANGCDSIVILQLTVKPNAASTINASICSGNSYSFNGQALTTAGSYSQTLTSANGCDSVITLNLTVKQTSTHSISASICAGELYSFNGQNLSTAGTYYDTLTNAVGCDSLITLNLTVKQVASTSINQSMCTGATYNFAGNTLSAAGTYKDTLTAANGCDSIVTLQLSVLPISTTSLSQSICAGTTYNFNGTLLGNAGSYTDTLTSANGCDSIVTLQLTVKPNATSTINVSICSGSSYSFHGQALTTAGSYSQTLTSANGCDSVVTLNLTVKQTSSHNINASVCAGETFSFNGQNLNTAGTYYDTLTNAVGCDSLIMLNLSVKPVGHTNINQSICSGAAYVFAGNVLTVGGTYRDTLTAANGCDSIITLQLTVWPVSNVVLNKTICNGSSYNFNGTVLSTAGTYYDTLSTVHGCDSTVVLNLALSDVIRDTISAAICNGGTYTFNGNVLSTTGNYSDTLSTSGGGDSIITLNLSVYPIATGTQTVMACDKYFWIDGNVYTSSNNIATHTIIGGSVNGCDSIITLNLTINSVATGIQTVTACGGYTWIDGNTYTSSNNTATHTITGGSVNGCDSIATLNLTINNISTGIQTVTTCGNYTWIDGNTYTSSNNTATHTIIGGSVNGCDSVVTLNLTINSVATGTQTVTTCGGYTWIDGNTYTSSNNTATHTITGGSVNGCDSIVTLNLTINNIATGIQTVTTCGNYTWIDGNTYTSSNNTATHTIVGGSVNSCDSIVTLNLTINQSLATSTSTSICAGDIYSFNGVNLTSAGVYSDTLTSANSCDSIVTLTLSVNQLPVPIIIQSNDTLYTQAFDSYQWLLNGNVVGSNSSLVLNVNGMYSIIVTDINGCTDTSAALNVTGVSVEEVTDVARVTIFPNPNKGNFTLLFSNTDEHTVYITDALGRLIINKMKVGQFYNFDLTDQSAGIYFVHVLQGTNWQSFKVSTLR